MTTRESKKLINEIESVAHNPFMHIESSMVVLAQQRKGAWKEITFFPCLFMSVLLYFPSFWMISVSIIVVSSWFVWRK